MRLQGIGGVAAMLLLGAVGASGCMQTAARNTTDEALHYSKSDRAPERAAAIDNKLRTAANGRERAAPPAPRPRPSAAPQRSADGRITTTAAYPTGDRETSAVVLSKTAPEQVNLGQPFEYDLTVTNISRNQLDGVTIADRFSDGFKLLSASPKPTSTEGGKATWTFPSLEAGASRTVRVRAQADEARDLGSCADVEYESKLCARIKVVEPKLQLAMKVIAPHSGADAPCVLRCEPIKLRYTVHNPGSGPATDVRVTSPLPEGLTTLGGRSSLSFSAGDIAPGRSKSFDVQLKAAKTGKFAPAAEASAAGGLSAKAGTDEFTVCEPALTLAIRGPEAQFLGRPTRYAIEVGNKGSGPAEGTAITVRLPAGGKLVDATQGWRKAKDGSISWDLGTLAQKASRKLSLTIAGSKSGTNAIEARGAASCAKPVSATARTLYRGVPAILLEVVDVEDPIEVEGEETYIITATNQGTAEGTNIRIRAEFEDKWSYVSSAGATRGSAAGRTVTFAPLAALTPKDKAVWKVTLKANDTGDTRFKISMTSDQLQRSVDETEATQIY